MAAPLAFAASPVAAVAAVAGPAAALAWRPAAAAAPPARPTRARPSVVAAAAGGAPAPRRLRFECGFLGRRLPSVAGPAPAPAAPAGPSAVAILSSGPARAAAAEEVARLESTLRERLGMEGHKAAEIAASVTRRRHNRGEESEGLLRGALDLFLNEWGVSPGAAAACLAARPSLVSAGVEELRRRMAEVEREFPAVPRESIVHEYYSMLAQRPETLRARAGNSRGLSGRPYGALASPERVAAGRRCLVEAGLPPDLVDRIEAGAAAQVAIATPATVGGLLAYLRKELGLSSDEVQRALRRQPTLIGVRAETLRERVEYLTSPEGPGLEPAAVRALLVKWSAVFSRDVDKVRAFMGVLKRRGYDRHDLQRVVHEAAFALSRDADRLLNRLESALAGPTAGLSKEDAARLVRLNPTLLSAATAAEETAARLRSDAARDFGVTEEEASRVLRLAPRVLCLRYEASLRPKLRALHDFGVLREALASPKSLAFSLDSRIWPRLAIALCADGALRLSGRPVSLRGLLEPADGPFAAQAGIDREDWAAFLRGAKEALGRARAAGWPREGADPLPHFVASIHPVYLD